MWKWKIKKRSSRLLEVAGKERRIANHKDNLMHASSYRKLIHVVFWNGANIACCDISRWKPRKIYIQTPEIGRFLLDLNRGSDQDSRFSRLIRYSAWLATIDGSHVPGVFEALYFRGETFSRRERGGGISLIIPDRNNTRNPWTSAVEQEHARTPASRSRDFKFKTRARIARGFDSRISRFESLANRISPEARSVPIPFLVTSSICLSVLNSAVWSPRPGDVRNRERKAVPRRERRFSSERMCIYWERCLASWASSQKSCLLLEFAKSQIEPSGINFINFEERLGVRTLDKKEFSECDAGRTKRLWHWSLFLVTRLILVAINKRNKLKAQAGSNVWVCSLIFVCLSLQKRSIDFNSRERAVEDWIWKDE